MATITIVSPMGGDAITIADDIDTALDGIQIDVSATSMGLGRGDMVDILVDDVGAGSPGMVDGDGEILFTSVTLTGAGTHELVAVTREGGVRSPPVTLLVDDSCATITFVAPVDPGTGRLVLGPPDDTDGEMCGVTFETTVSIATDAGDGSEVRVSVNGTPRTSGIVVGTAATIEGIALDNRGDTPNTLSVTVTRPDGVDCTSDFPAQIFVDCAGASCEITQPDSTTPFLNSSEDRDPVTPGFQGQFVVTTDSEGVGQAIRLIIDGDETSGPSALPMMVGTGGESTFGSVDLSEGLHRFAAECEDGVGNRTRSGTVEWTIDTVLCGITISDPDGSRTITDVMDDTDPGTLGIQLRVTGDYAGTDCDMVRVGNCATIDTQAFAMSGAAFDVIADLPTDPMQELCAQIQDVAGNVGEDRVSLVVRVMGPQLSILTPTAGACFNDAGGGAMACTADLDPPSGTCEVAFSVACTDVGADVTLHEIGMAAVLTGGTAACVADAGASPPFMGRADFAMVSLPAGDLTPVAIEARQSADGLTGTTSESFISDCSPPVFSFIRPVCGEVLRPAMLDEDPGAAGFQYGVDVFNTNVPKPTVDLTIVNGSGGTVHSSSSSTPATGLVTEFRYPDFTAGGLLTITACGSDAIGNRGCNIDAPCTVNVIDIPTLGILEPSDRAILGAGDDCDLARAGMQIQVTANTDAAIGSTGTIQVGSLPMTSPIVTAGGSPNQIDDCVDAPEGVSIPVVVTATNPRGTVMATVNVTIDSMPPTGAITDFAPVTPAVDRRAGEVNFTWTAVSDVGGGLLTRYELRCSTDGPIASEAEWTAATVITTTVIPAAGATMQMDTVRGFRLGEERWCALRGFDVANAATPLPASPPASVTLEPTEVALTAPGDGEGYVIAGIGDVNGDTFGDVLVGVGFGNDTAHVYFGSATGPSTTPDITIVGSTTFGLSVANLGDVSGDGVPDFAVSQFGAGLGSASFDSAGSVYVFFGRTSSDPAWPATIDVSVAACAADLCFTSIDTPALLGLGLAAAGDFDGDGVDDLAIGAFRANSNAGRVFVIRGRSSWTPGSAFTLPGPTEPDGFMIEAPAATALMGASVTTCGDLGSDMRSDLIVGAPGGTGADGQILRADGRPYPAATTGLVTIAGVMVTSLDTSTFALGDPVACIGDYNRDGSRDLAAGNLATSAGQVRVYLQSGGSYSGASSLDITNDAPSSGSDLFGNSIGLGYHPLLGNLGDLDGDGTGDLFLGASQLGLGPSEAALFYGSSGVVATVRSAASAAWNPATGDATGRRTAAYIGDVTGDGFPDFAIGDPDNMTGAGRVLIYH